jgi:hypothetical protein
LSKRFNCSRIGAAFKARKEAGQPVKLVRYAVSCILATDGRIVVKLDKAEAEKSFCRRDVCPEMPHDGRAFTFVRTPKDPDDESTAEEREQCKVDNEAGDKVVQFWEKHTDYSIAQPLTFQPWVQMMKDVEAFLFRMGEEFIYVDRRLVELLGEPAGALKWWGTSTRDPILAMDASNTFLALITPLNPDGLEPMTPPVDMTPDDDDEPEDEE